MEGAVSTQVPEQTPSHTDSSALYLATTVGQLETSPSEMRQGQGPVATASFLVHVP